MMAVRMNFQCMIFADSNLAKWILTESILYSNFADFISEGDSAANF